MDLSSVLQPLIQALWYLIPLAILGGIIQSPHFKGWVGESLVNLSARLFLDKNTYHLIRNVTLPTEDGTTQIDHVIVSPYGVFVVDTRDMKGGLYGSAEQPNWLQRRRRYVKRFENPLFQSREHLKTLWTLLGLNAEQVHSLVVFLGKGGFGLRCRGMLCGGEGIWVGLRLTASRCFLYSKLER
ncbi:nuclease-related domain-containing protein [Marinobacter halodurans]|uniref:nuclease-related domain-containing protein n=1 Tax=Marinobacter halodurans TaxID=2528979 RepID=UPI001A9561A6|nr:nuclease-related domain-containing protein [Marinobacter halodurans]